MDATVHKAVSDRFKISGFPTVKYFEKGEEKYTLPQLRNKDKIIEFMHKWVSRLTDSLIASKVEQLSGALIGRSTGFSRLPPTVRE